MMDIRYIDSTDDRRSISCVYENSWKTAYKGINSDDYLKAKDASDPYDNIDDRILHDTDDHTGCRRRFGRHRINRQKA